MRSCPSGKYVYGTRRRALRALDRVRESRRRLRWRPPDWERSVYRCPACGFWHLTHLAPQPKEGQL